MGNSLTATDRHYRLDRALDRYGLAGRKVLVSAVGEIPQCSSKLVETAFVRVFLPAKIN
jgi:hypothetical protein